VIVERCDRRECGRVIPETMIAVRVERKARVGNLRTFSTPEPRAYCTPLCAADELMKQAEE
jgi:hypothetical protein